MAQRTVFLNGRVFVSDAARSWERCVAVEGDRIVAVGNESDVAPFSAGAEVIDLEGRLLTPGFTDGHVHPYHGGRKLLGCNLLDAGNREEAIRAVERYVSDNPGQEWISGGGWSQDWFERGCPSSQELDAVVGGRPVFLVNRDGHGGWASTEALKRAGIDAATGDPDDGRIERLEDGTPQGTLHEGAMALVERVMPPVGDQDVERALLQGQAHLLAHGITGWMDAWVEEPLHRAYQSLAGRGELIGSVVGALWWDRELGVEQVERLEEWRRQGVPGYRPSAVKLMLDGVMENYTASLLAAYEQVGGTGIDMIDPGDLKTIVSALDGAGFQCHFHAVGDGAVRSALDAVESARMANGWSGSRHSISHLQLVDPDDIVRFHRLAVAADAQPLWACEDGYQEELTRPFLGGARSERQYPFGDLVAAGATLVGGSDWSVSTCDVMRQVHVAVHRTPAEDPDAVPLAPDQALDPITALAGYTSGSAWHNGDGERGTVAVGNVADLVVFDRDPFAEDSFDKAKVGAVMARGRWVSGEGAG